MTFCQQWLEEDYNPFLLFNSDGKINSLNTAAQFLLSETSVQTLFNLASSYASASFGFKRTHIDISYGKYRFFAIEVGYETEEEIGIRLYRLPSQENNILNVKNNHEQVNIYTILDLTMSTHLINHDTHFDKVFDPSLPDVRLDANLLISYITHVYESYKEAHTIRVVLALKTGEYLKIEGKKYPIFTLSIQSDDAPCIVDESTLTAIAHQMGATLHCDTSAVYLDLVLYT